MIVSKFGGTSLASAEQIRKVREIVRSKPERQYVIVSAPGKAHIKDIKVTDLLYQWHGAYQNSEAEAYETSIHLIRTRYEEILAGLKLDFDLEGELENIDRALREGASADYAASRGEYLNGKIIALALGYEFVDSASCILFDQDGNHRGPDSYALLRHVLGGYKAVIPGFYGSLPDGSIKTFSRGGSDITGAIVARAVGARVYENWTDVSGLLMADPRVVECPKGIEEVTYRELRELSYMGANVFHEEAMFPVQEAGIVTNIRNTNIPEHPGTRIVVNSDTKGLDPAITGIAGRKDFTVITIEKRMMNQQVGFVRQILTILESNEVSFEHMPSGIDTLSIIIDNRQLVGKIEKIVSGIQESCSPDTIETYPSMAMIAIVGQAMARAPGVAARIFDAVAKAGIKVRMINQGSSAINVIIGVENEDYENAVRAIYGAFVR